MDVGYELLNKIWQLFQHRILSPMPSYVTLSSAFLDTFFNALSKALSYAIT